MGTRSQAKLATNEEAPGVGAPRASGSSNKAEVTGMDNIIPQNKSQQGAQVVPFRGNQLLLVDHLDEPYVPMRPVVTGMGMDWKSQYAKIKGGRLSSVVAEITTTGADGKRYSMICMPLRKLPGWLMSINAGKVRESIREQVMAYQSECDDVLWQYWNEGHAANHRTNPDFGTILNQTIGTDGFHCLAAVLDGKVRHLPAPMRRRAKGHIWSQIHKAFSVVSAEDIPADQMDSARNFVAAYTLEGEWLPADRNDEYSYPVKRWLANNPALAQAQVGRNRLSIPAAAVSMAGGADSPTRQVLGKLRAAGHDVEACFIEMDALQHHLEASRNRLLRVAEDVHRTAGGALQVHRRAG